MSLIWRVLWKTQQCDYCLRLFCMHWCASKKRGRQVNKKFCELKSVEYRDDIKSRETRQGWHRWMWCSSTRGICTPHTDCLLRHSLHHTQALYCRKACKMWSWFSCARHLPILVAWNNHCMHIGCFQYCLILACPLCMSLEAIYSAMCYFFTVHNSGLVYSAWST